MKKILTTLLMTALLFSLSSCSKSEDVTLQDINLGKLSAESIDIMGVTYDFYDNGYAFIKSILHDNAQLSDKITYNGKDYTIIGIGYLKKNNSASTTGEGVFGNGYSGIASPTNLVLPDSIQYIASNALQYSTAKTITLPSRVTKLGVGVFLGCSNIETIDFPDTITYIGGYSLFSGCTNLKTVKFPNNCEIGTVANCFMECSSLESVTIPGTVKEVGDMTFCNCYELSDVILEEGIETIGTWAFATCPKLSTLVIPESVTLIEEQAFYNCVSLTDITLPDNLTDVSANLFMNEYSQPADVSNLTIHVKEDLVSYVQNIYPTATVVAK